uniref:zinc-binding protein A33-like n=1 Tax=Erigeron canadensis TaxID=72917 RepID=UPI001CB9ADDB|nr:zinc-binding protein A33-like [Erigeron canadensis]
MDQEKQTDSDVKKNRNILDMLKDDQGSGSKKNWKVFRDKIRLKRAGKAWKSSLPVPASDIPMENKTNRMMIRRGSARYPSDDSDAEEQLDGEATRQLGHMPERQRSIRLLPVETDPEEEEEGDTPSEDGPKQDEGKGDQPISLMTLLSDTGSNYIDDPEEEQHHDENDDHEEEEEEEDIGDCNICCGCKGKHKGAAIGPCGHTFCKHCTKELHVSRGNCPTCNDFILEILDIY